MSDADCGNVQGACQLGPPSRCVDFVGDYANGAFFTRPPHAHSHFLVPYQRGYSFQPDALTSDQVYLSEVSW